jgi:hypothetical protein
MQQDVVQRFASLQRRGDKYTQIVGYPCLTLEVRKGEGTQLFFQVCITGKSYLFPEIELIVNRFFT